MSAHEGTTGFVQSLRATPVSSATMSFAKQGRTFCSSAPTALWETRHENYEEAVEVHKD